MNATETKPTETPAAAPAAAEASKTETPKKAPAKATGPTGKQLAAEFEKQLKAKVGTSKVERVEKQTYVVIKMKNGGEAIAYIHPAKKHCRVNIGIDIPNPDHIGEVVEFVMTSIDLQKAAAEATPEA